ncbi:hypothetical protein ABK040_015595 [Willaertia magna]
MQGFFQRHKRKFFIGGIATGVLSVGAGVFYYWYKTKKDESQERAKREQQMRYLFNENKKTSKIALLSILPNTLEYLLQSYPIETLMEELKIKKNQLTSDKKKEIWEQIKIQSFTRVITSLYSLCLLDSLICIQVSMIGRHLYMEHTFKNKKIEEGIEDELLKNHLSLSTDRISQQRFLNYAGHFQKNGIIKLQNIIEQHVKNHVSNLSLSHQFSPNDFKELIESIRKQIDNQFENQSDLLLNILFPSSIQEEKDEKVLILLNELSDLLESPEYLNVSKETCNSAFHLFYERVENYMIKFTQSNLQNNNTLQPPIRMYMANINSWMAAEVTNILSKVVDQEEEDQEQYTDIVHESPYLNKYCILIYARDLLFQQSK